MIVIDASAIVELLFKTKAGEKIADIIFKNTSNIVAPELLNIEVLQVVRKFRKSREISNERAREFFDDFVSLPIKYYPHSFLLKRIWELKENFTAYDSTYIALAELLNAPLITTDLAFKRGRVNIHKADIIIPI